MAISRLNSTLRRRKRAGILKKIAFAAVFVLFFISLFILALTSRFLIVRNVAVSGNASIASADIAAIVENDLSDRHFGLVRTDNIFLIERSKIRNDILAAMPKIESAAIHFHGLTSIEVAVVERLPAALWCAGAPASAGDCAFMDKTGFVYAPAPSFAGNPYPEYFGLLASGTPAVGQNYFSPARFPEAAAFFSKLADMGFSPAAFDALSADEYEVALAGGGVIRLNDSQSFDVSLADIQALIDSGYIKTAESFLAKLDYIDLRFGEKVAFAMKK